MSRVNIEKLLTPIYHQEKHELTKDEIPETILFPIDFTVFQTPDATAALSPPGTATDPPVLSSFQVHHCLEMPILFRNTVF